MKNIRGVILEIYITTLKFSKKLNFHLRQVNNSASVLILPPSDSGSLGDEAMVSSVIDFYRSKKASRISVILRDRECTPRYIRKAFPDVETILFRNSIHFANLVKSYDYFCCLGADMMDGYYGDDATLHILKLASIASRLGVQSSILGFSFNEKPTQVSISALKNLSSDILLCARDPVSFRRMQNKGVKNVRLVADLAFLLRPAQDSATVLETLNWIKLQKDREHIAIGINANYRHVKDLDLATAEDLAQPYVKAISELYKKFEKISFVFLPHDFRKIPGEISDDDFAKLIYGLLPQEIKQNCLKLEYPLMASEIKAVCKELDIVLSGRMHLAIACLGQGTPPICITYQGKFEGLFEHFELSDMTISPQEAMQFLKLSEFVSSFIEKRDILRKNISAKLPSIRKLSQKNFD